MLMNVIPESCDLRLPTSDWGVMCPRNSIRWQNTALHNLKVHMHTTFMRLQTHNHISFNDMNSNLFALGNLRKEFTKNSPKSRCPEQRAPPPRAARRLGLGPNGDVPKSQRFQNAFWRPRNPDKNIAV